MTVGHEISPSLLLPVLPEVLTSASVRLEYVPEFGNSHPCGSTKYSPGMFIFYCNACLGKKGSGFGACTTAWIRKVLKKTCNLAET